MRTPAYETVHTGIRRSRGMGAAVRAVGAPPACAPIGWVPFCGGGTWGGSCTGGAPGNVSRIQDELPGGPQGVGHPPP